MLGTYSHNFSGIVHSTEHIHTKEIYIALGTIDESC